MSAIAQHGTTQATAWTSAEARAATDGESYGSWTATGVSIDSRTVAPGDLFVAIAGPSFDGHEFVGEAIARGAVAAMVHRPPPGVAGDTPLLAVPDTLQGLEALGRYARHRTRAQILAVTGSVGKTSTKEALRAALEPQGPTFASQGNLNNHWGVPLSLARMPAGTRYGIFELGMNHAGEIAPLSRLVKPDAAIITTVEPVHLEYFPSEEAIADAKAEIFAGMGPHGCAILNRDNRHFARLVAHARTEGISRIWSFGRHEGADARLVDHSLHATASAVTAVIRGEMIQYSLAAPGMHWVLNSLAVLLAVRAIGGDLAQGARALARLAPMLGRGGRRRLRLPGSDEPTLLIDDSYNASPASMRAAFAVLGQAETGALGRRIAVVGDMLELGPRAGSFHAELAADLAASGVDAVYACGPHMRALYEALPRELRSAHAEDSATLAGLVADAVRPGDVVLVKGSLGMRMATIVKRLEALDRTPAGNGEDGPGHTVSKVRTAGER